MDNKGSITIHLKELLEKSGLSKNKFCQKTELQRSQLNGYLNNTITRLDVDVLVRICYTLNCSLSDLLEYCKPELTPSERSPHEHRKPENTSND